MTVLPSLFCRWAWADRNPLCLVQKASADLNGTEAAGGWLTIDLNTQPRTPGGGGGGFGGGRGGGRGGFGGRGGGRGGRFGGDGGFGGGRGGRGGNVSLCPCRLGSILAFSSWLAVHLCPGLIIC